MIRRLIPLLALPLTLAAPASVSLAAEADALGFTLSGTGGRAELAASFSRDGHHSHMWTASLAPGELGGLDLASFQDRGSNPLRFALTRQSGRLDCAGTGGSSRASGACSFTPDPGFASALAAAQIAVPADSWLDLFAVDVDRALVESVRAAGYPPPDFDTLIALSAVGVDGDYIRALAASGYRPRSLDTLVELRAVGVTPEWIASMVAAGYANIAADELVGLRALGVDGAYIQSLRAAGYGNLGADTLMELKALGVTADFARSAERQFGRLSADRLVELKALGFDRRR